MTVRALFLAGIAVAGSAAAEEVPTLESCEQERASAPSELDSYTCFHRLTRVPGGRHQATARLEELVEIEPGNTHARLMLARVLSARLPRVLELFEQAIDEYTGANKRLALGWASIYRSRALMVNMRLEEAEADAGIAVLLAEEFDDYGLLALCRFQQSRIASLRGDDGALFGLLRTLVLDPRFETLAPNFRGAVLQNLGSVCGELNLRQTGMEYLRRAETLALENDLPIWLFDARLSMSSIAMSRFHDGEVEREEALAIARGALEVAGSGWRRFEAERRVAELTAGEEGIRMLRELASDTDDKSFGEFEIQTALGLRLLTGEPGRIPESIEPLERALEAAQNGPLARNVARGLSNLALARLETAPQGEAIEAALRAMDGVERLHDLQTGETIGAINFSVYSQIYYATIGKLLTDPLGADLDLALQVSERLRSRSLIEHLRRAAGPSTKEDEKSASERRKILSSISDLQLRLIVGKLDADERQRVEADLERLEEEEALLRASMDRFGPLPSRETATIETIQRELRGDEALLSMLLSTPGSGGSWLFVLTSTDVRVYPLPSRRTVESSVRFWLGLLQRGDGSEREPATRLYRDLLAAALTDLPAGIGRLIVVPDGSLHRVPFDALRSGPDEPPLVERFEITHAPSASVWLLLRGGPDTATDARALILADPEFPRASLDHAALRAFRLTDVSIGRLPFARREARSVLRSLGDGDIRVGAAATEAFLKQADLRNYRLVHFAAHALIDEDAPDRSAILLAPGADTEDGLLQAREVLDLDLSGAMVTLSACRSAGGRVIAGEGVMGLARSFFQAGASVVIGGLWPLRDEVTATLMESFYRNLGQGLSAGAAMTQAKREMVRSGAPASAWAGLVVLGDGTRAPWRDAGGLPGSSYLRYVALGVALAGTLLLFLAFRRRQARRDRRVPDVRPSGRATSCKVPRPRRAGS